MVSHLRSGSHRQFAAHFFVALGAQQAHALVQGPGEFVLR
jgi:hypothetical protein